MIIAVDGPAGAGKSTVAREVARRLAFLYIDTGAMYRALTLKALDGGIGLNNAQSIVNMAGDTRLHLDNDENGCLRIFMDGKDVSREIRQPRITKSVSIVAKISGVRQVMLDIQRRIGEEKKDVVLDGRDIGTVVFPDAGKKFYLDADFRERVRRRYKEMIDTGERVTTEDIEEDLKNRDLLDSTRECAPLKKADDAIYIDTTRMTVEEVVNRLLKELRSNLKS
jgi:cytidylate kinase